MTVKDVEERLPISRANIRYYEKEGLFQPARLENGYRNYSEEDVERLKQIILFRKIGISVSDIKQIIEGKKPVSDAVKENMAVLQSQMEELQGSIELCGQMLKDDNIDKAFAVDQYWQIMEKKERAGRHFINYLHDYVDFEGKSFLAMWENVFFITLRETTAGKGWIITLCIVLCICVIRGLSMHFLLKVGSFWEGFLYPFMLFGILTVITLPLYALNEIYRERGTKTAEEDSKETAKWRSRHPRQAGLLKALAFIAGFILIIFGPLFVGDGLMEFITGIQINYIISYPLNGLYFTVSVYFYIVLYWLNSKRGIFGNLWTGEQGYICRLSRKMKYKTALFSFLVYLLMNILYFGCYRCANEDGLKIANMYAAENYSWDEIKHVKLRASVDGTLQYIIFTDDGRKMDLTGSSVASIFVDDSKYPEEEDSFVLELTKRFVRQGVDFDVNWDKLEKKLTYDYWKEYAKKLRAVGA